MKRYRKPPEEVLLKTLNEISFRVTQCNAEEKPFSSVYNFTFQEGIYVDIVTGEPLFSSRDKLYTDCGWPSFCAVISDNSVREFNKSSFGIERIEVRSRIGNSHLGHLFNDGPKELGGLRYCINGAALKFIPREGLKINGYDEFAAIFE